MSLRVPLLELVPPSWAGEDSDFAHRFQEERLNRWMRGYRNGMSIRNLVGLAIGHSEFVRFRGKPVDSPDLRTTIRVIEDVWMRGEYDLPGYVPGPGWRVLDVGANVGIFSMLAAARGAEVHSWEPSPRSFAALRQNMARWNGVCTQSAVVGKMPDTGTVSLYLHPRDTRHTVNPEQAENYPDSIKVPAVPISEVLSETCDLLKIDCEGAEFEILRAAGSRLRNARRLIVEVEDRVDDPRALLSLVREAGFDAQLHESFPGVGLFLLTGIRR